MYCATFCLYIYIYILHFSLRRLVVFQHLRSSTYEKNCLFVMAPSVPPIGLLPLPAVRVGRLVTNVVDPRQRWYDPDCDSNAIDSVKTEYDMIHRFAGNEILSRTLPSLLTSYFRKSGDITIHIRTDQAKTYFLGQSDKWLRNALNQDGTVKWTERAKGKIYMVVGYLTVLDADVVERLGTRGVREYSMEGEQICAVQYREVHRPWGWSWLLRDQPNMTLSKRTRWVGAVATRP